MTLAELEAMLRCRLSQICRLTANPHAIATRVYLREVAR